MLDAVVISDLHLGFGACRADALEAFLGGLPATRRLVLNGDVLHSTASRLTRRDWRVLSAVRRLSDHVEVVWVAGNHDWDAEPVAHLVGADFVPLYGFAAGGNRYLCVHGDGFDEFVTSRPVATWLADRAHRLLHLTSPRLALTAKRSAKRFLRNCAEVREKAAAFAARRGATAVFCGHTHHAEGPDHPGGGEVGYANSGCWTEPHCHYLAVAGETVTLKEFVP